MPHHHIREFQEATAGATILTEAAIRPPAISNTSAQDVDRNILSLPVRARGPVITPKKLEKDLHLSTNVHINAERTALHDLHLPSPVLFEKLKPYLHGYPGEKKKYLENGFKHGFRLRVRGEVPFQNEFPPNPKMSLEEQKIMGSKIRDEVLMGRVAGPFSNPPFDRFHISPVRLEPKKVGGYRFIHNLSYPHDSELSVNSNIPQEEKTCSYTSLDEAIASIKALGKGVFLAKTDIKSAFKIIPVHPDDYRLLGFRWEGQFYYAKTLPMGAGSSCAIFEEFSTAVAYVAENKLGIQKCHHILDDFLLIVDGRDRCRSSLTAFLSFCKEVGIPIAPEKTHDPSQIMDFVGVGLNVQGQYSFLPEDKVTRCIELLDELCTRPKVTKTQIQQLQGHLNFASRAIVPGRPFMAATYALSRKLRKPHHKAWVTKLVREDWEIWKKFLLEFNGRSFFLADYTSTDLHLYTDAATSGGFGACLNKEWVCGKWHGAWTDRTILALETYAVVVALAIWGEQLSNKHIIFHIDNQALVGILQTGHTQSEEVIPLIRVIYSLGLKYNITFHAEYISTRHNVAADALSRFNFQEFRRYCPDAAYLPRRIPDWVHTRSFNPWDKGIHTFLQF